MDFQIGDRVVHASHGIGQIVRLEERVLSTQAAVYYVVQTQDLQVWVPVQDSDHCSLRFPTPPAEYERLFSILSSPAEPLPVDRIERKRLLVERMKEGTLDAVCRVVRDLDYHIHNKKTSDHDALMLERASAFLIAEWSDCLSVPPVQAERELQRLLHLSRG